MDLSYLRDYDRYHIGKSIKNLISCNAITSQLYNICYVIIHNYILKKFHGSLITAEG